MISPISMDGEDQKPSLESPLISQESVSETRSGAKREEILSEVKLQLKLAGPPVLFNLLLFGLQVISVMFVGHLGELALSGASMATSFASVTGFSLLVTINIHGFISFYSFYLQLHPNLINLATFGLYPFDSHIVILT